MLTDNVSSATVSWLMTASATSSSPQRPLLETVTIAAVLVLLILACVIGNVFVILAIVWDRDLRGRPQYYLIFSLAVADLIVGLIVTPLGAWSTVTGAWRLGVTLCDLWISVDVLVCTASILHLVAIALDRYWSITDICYVQNRTPKRITLMLAVIWMTSLLISLAPFAGWKDDGFEDRVQKQHVCLISQRISYQITAVTDVGYAHFGRRNYIMKLFNAAHIIRRDNIIALELGVFTLRFTGIATIV
uniref:G_PROTEIN_RECEP_F1_2 domain-containing protein n=1 Tax=Heterorhabditis bacteriophora TaxID=37862 RepID=A0A1I7XSD2_HETBA